MNLARKGIYMSIASTGGGLLMLAAYAVVARIVPKAAFGEYQVAGTFASIAALAAYPNMPAALVTAAARKAYGTFPLAAAAVFRRARYGMIGLLATAVYYAVTGRYGLATAIAVSIPFFAPSAISGFYEAYCVGTGSVRAYAAHSLGASFAAASAFVIAGLVFPAYAAPLVFAISCAGAATTGLWAYRASTSPVAQSGTVSYEALSFGKKTSWIESVAWTANYADILLLNAFLEPREVAVYGIARIAPEAIKGLVKNLGVLSAARIAIMEKGAVRKMLTSRLIQATLIAFACALAYVLAAPTFFRLVFPIYPEAAPFSQLLAISFLAFPAHLAESALDGLLHKKGSIILTGAGTSTIFIFSLILIPPLGILGAVSARILARFANAVIALWLVWRLI